jgi:hypothetical protein
MGSDTSALAFVMRLFPDAHLMHLVREPCDCAASLRRWKREGPPRGGRGSSTTLRSAVADLSWCKKYAADYRGP